MIAWPDTTHLPADAFELPRQPTPAVLQVLRLLPTELHDVGRVLERAGFSVPRHPRDSFASALFFLLPYAIAYGDEWWPRAEAQLALMDPVSGPSKDRSDP